MPTYTAPTTRSSGFLVTAAVYNTDLVENIKFFKDAPTFDGAVTASTTLAVGTGLTYTTSVKSTTALATPGALSATQATAFASTVSGAAIMGFGTTNDVSLMNRAGTVVLGIGPNTTTVNMTGLLTVSGFGQNTFSAGGNQTNSIRVENTSAGTAAVAAFNARNDSTWNGGFRVLSSTYTTSGPDIAEGANLHWNGSGGLSIAATNASGTIRFYTGGSTERVKIDSNGAMTKAAQPAFLAAAALQSNVTGDGTLYTILFSTEVFDQANNFSSPTFTAPITGRYQLSVICMFSGLTSAHDNCYIQLTTSNRNYTDQFQNIGTRIANDTQTLKLSILADMDAGDTAIVQLSVSGSGGTKVVDVQANYGYFSGFLAC